MHIGIKVYSTVYMGKVDIYRRTATTDARTDRYGRVITRLFL